MQTGRNSGGHWRSPLAGFLPDDTKTTFNARTPLFRIAVEIFATAEISLRIEQRSDGYG
jgi:hypothetical protein